MRCRLSACPSGLPRSSLTTTARRSVCGDRPQLERDGGRGRKIPLADRPQGRRGNMRRRIHLRRRRDLRSRQAADLHADRGRRVRHVGWTGRQRRWLSVAPRLLRLRRRGGRLMERWRLRPRGDRRRGQGVGGKSECLEELPHLLLLLAHFSPLGSAAHGRLRHLAGRRLRRLARLARSRRFLIACPPLIAFFSKFLPT